MSIRCTERETSSGISLSFSSKALGFISVLSSWFRTSSGSSVSGHISACDRVISTIFMDFNPLFLFPAYWYLPWFGRGQKSQHSGYLHDLNLLWEPGLRSSKWRWESGSRAEGGGRREENESSHVSLEPVKGLQSAKGSTEGAEQGNST